VGIVLVVDDEPNILKVLSARLKKHDHDVLTSLTAEEAMQRLTTENVDVLLSDYMLPGKSGMHLLSEAKEKFPNLPVIMMTAYGSIEMAVEAMKQGAYDYLTKPVDYGEMCLLIDRAIQERALVRSKEPKASSSSFAGMIGKSPEMRQVFDTVMRVADTRATILIEGESGTGKELVAKSLHFESFRKKGPFVAVNCSAIPETLLENELFGHEKGSYTGAHRREKGKFELADTGTLFLDEITSISSAVQSKLLRVLQERAFERIGGNEEIKVDIRVVTSTQKNLEDLVGAGHFREDLYYRLNVIKIKLPPLRERKSDIPLLARHFMRKYSKENNKGIKSFDPEVTKALLRYDWPGNIRELENDIERAVVMCSSDRIVPENIRRSIISRAAPEALLPDVPSAGLNLRELEKAIILKALEKNRWNQTTTAQFLKMTRKQLRTKMKHYELLGHVDSK